MLKADISKAVADAAQLGKEISGLDEDVSIWNGDKKAATSVRQIEKTDYDAMHTDYSESVDALQRAIAVLKKQAHDRKQKSSLTQVAALKNIALIPDKAKKIINAFLSTEEDDMEAAAPEANGYEFQSSAVVEMLEKLLDKFVDERTTLEKEEMNSKHAYDMLMQDLNAQIAQGTQDRDEKAESKAKKLQAKADATGDLNDTTTTMNADSKYLADLTATCEQKASDFESRQQLRADEIVAIEKAIEIISSGAVSGAAEKHLPTLVQRATSLAQLRADGNGITQKRVARYLQERGQALNSRILSTLAVRVVDDPF